jgi:hypothetical protein
MIKTNNISCCTIKKTLEFNGVKCCIYKKFLYIKLPPKCIFLLEMLWESRDFTIVENEKFIFYNPEREQYVKFKDMFEAHELFENSTHELFYKTNKLIIKF